jgi:NAD(P)-dependent dehydrogenase (short-subunit alcohol dehydrogenase family)
MKLSGRVALVTGAASGIGRATTIALANAGVDLALLDIDDAALGTFIQ